MVCMKVFCGQTTVLLDRHGMRHSVLCEELHVMYCRQDSRTERSCSPWEHLHLWANETHFHWFWTAEQGDNKSVDVLVAMDHFTKLAYAFPCKNQSAKQLAHHLWNSLFCVYGFPRRVYSDQSPSFESKHEGVAKYGGFQETSHSPYHLMGNGITERFNKTLGNMIRALPPRSKVKWLQSLQTRTFYYNCTIHKNTGFAAFYLMFGRVPHLWCDVRTCPQGWCCCDLKGLKVTLTKLQKWHRSTVHLRKPEMQGSTIRKWKDHLWLLVTETFWWIVVSMANGKLQTIFHRVQPLWSNVSEIAHYCQSNKRHINRQRKDCAQESLTPS